MLEKINNVINDIELNTKNPEKICLKLLKYFNDNKLETIYSIILVMIEKYNYNPLKNNNNVEKLVKERIGQAKFRDEIIKRDKQCLITGDNYKICEACHIIPYCETKSFDIENGILLNKCLHFMFDNFMFSINLSGCVEFSNEIILDQTYVNYHKYNGKELKLTNDTKLLLKKHYEKFLLINKNFN